MVASSKPAIGRVSRACDRCRKDKIKCDGLQACRRYLSTQSPDQLERTKGDDNIRCVSDEATCVYGERHVGRSISSKSVQAMIGLSGYDQYLLTLDAAMAT